MVVNAHEMRHVLPTEMKKNNGLNCVSVKCYQRTNLEQCDVIVMHYIEIVLRMRDDALHFYFLPIVCMRISTRYSQLNGPTIDVVQ